MTEPREDVIVRLVEVADEDELRTVVALHEPTPDELKIAGRVLTLLTLNALEDAGAVRHSGTVLDLGQRQLYALKLVYDVAAKWWVPPTANGGVGDPRTLGDVLKVMPFNDAQDVRGYLIWGGLLPEV